MILFLKGHVQSLLQRKLIHAYGPMKKTVIMGINQTIERIKLTANLKIIGIKDLKSKGSLSLPRLPL